MKCDRNEVAPRNGHTLVVGIVARISGCATQSDTSLEDQVDHAKEAIREIYTGETDYRVISTHGKGEQLDRPELAKIEEMLRSRELDFLVVEDLGRLIRGSEANRFCGIAVDHGTRVLALHDCIDTADDDWEDDVLGACQDHVNHNSHTSKRLKNKLMNRFRKYGGATAVPIAGYIKPDGVKSYTEWLIDESATPTIRRAFDLFLETFSYASVARFFNRVPFPLGPYCRRQNWDSKMARRFLENPILKGKPARGTRRTVKHHETGHRISVRNPEGPIYFDCPQLAHVDESLFDEAARVRAERFSNRGRKPVNGQDPRARIPKKSTRFPGQHAECWYCGRQLVWGGNGITDHLMCSGSREYRCWNSVGADGPIAARRIADAVAVVLCELDGFSNQFTQLVRSAAERVDDSSSRQMGDLDYRERQLAMERETFFQNVASLRGMPMIEEKARELETRTRELASERSRLERMASRAPCIPSTVDDLRDRFQQSIAGLAIDSPDFGALLRIVVPDVHVYLVRLCDGGHPVARARIRIDLTGIAPDARLISGLPALLTQVRDLDLFDPPQRAQIREQAVSMRSEGLLFRQIAERLPGNVTTTAVQKAVRLQMRMDELGLASPYVRILQPPADYPKLRRHKNPSYEFRFAEGYAPPSLD